MKDLFNEPPTGFDDFWATVPHKIGKHNAKKAWAKLRAEHRQSAADKVVAFYQWFKAEYPTASPLHPSTYLNGHRWDDVTSEPEKRSDIEASIRNGLASTVPSVREHATIMAKRHGIKTGEGGV